MEKLKNSNSHSYTKTGIWLRSNVWTILLTALVLVLLLSKDAKALAIRGLMHTGIMGRPLIERTAAGPRAGASQPSAGFTENTNEGPDGTLQNEQGRIFKLSDLKGKVVFINFWATWCPPCRAEMPGIRDLKVHFAKDTTVVFLVVDVDGKLKQSASYLRRKDLGQLLNISGTDSLSGIQASLQENSLVKMLSPLPPELEATSVPASFVLDRKGHVVMRYIGAADYMHPAFLKAFQEFVGQ